MVLKYGDHCTFISRVVAAPAYCELGWPWSVLGTPWGWIEWGYIDFCSKVTFDTLYPALKFEIFPLCGEILDFRWV